MSVGLKRFRFTRADYYRLVGAGVLGEDDRVELIEGEILEMSPIGPRHTGCVKRVNALLGEMLRGRAIISVQDPVQLNEYSEAEPDLALLELRADYYAAGHPTPETVRLVVEIADSSLDYDQHIKAPLYARNHVQEYWLVNLVQNHLVVYRDPREGSYATVRVSRRGETVSPLAFPDLQIAVADILG